MALPRFSPAIQPHCSQSSRDPVTAPPFSSSSSSFPLPPRNFTSLQISPPSGRRPLTWRRRTPMAAAENEAAAEGRAGYDWREEWYPLYLSDEVPKDAPLGLSVFGEKLVLYRGGDGSFCCFEDRCPHR